MDTKDVYKNGGRPPKFKSPEEMQEKILQYFEEGGTTRLVETGRAENKQVKEIKVFTITGLSLFLGFCDRHSFYDYENRPEFSHTVKAGRALMEKNYEEILQTGNTIGAIFALKNFGWKDKQEIELTKPMEVHLKNYTGADDAE